MFVESKLSAWLVKELDARGWSHRELSRRASVSQTTVSDVISEKRPATWDFCAAMARALGVSADDVFVLAGLKPAPPPPVPEESEALSLLRDLPTTERSVVLKQLRGLAGQPPPVPVPTDRARLQAIVDRLNRLPRDRQDRTIDTILMLLEIAEAGSGEDEEAKVLSNAAHTAAESGSRA